MRHAEIQNKTLPIRVPGSAAARPDRASVPRHGYVTESGTVPPARPSLQYSTSTVLRSTSAPGLAGRLHRGAAAPGLRGMRAAHARSRR
eukprot:763891-Hanusia_phi.AAC.3